MSASVSDVNPRYRGLARPPKGARNPGSGRSKGTPNHVNGDIKKMIVHALNGAGGVDYLIKQAHKNPVAFMSLVGRVLPLQVTGEGGGRLQVEFKWADAPITPVIEANAETNAVEAIKDAVLVDEHPELASEDDNEVEVVFGQRNEG